MHKVQIKREAEGLSRKELAEMAEVAEATLRDLENGSSDFFTQISVAERLADALYMKVSDLFDKRELSHLGRPAATGRPIGPLQLIDPRETVCNDHGIIHWRTVTCFACDMAA